MAFVCKETTVLVANNNNDILVDLANFLTLYLTTYLSWLEWLCFYGFQF